MMSAENDAYATSSAATGNSSHAHTNNSNIRSPATGSVSQTSTDDGAAIVRNIASFLTLSDATSMVSIALPAASENEYTAESDSWAIGEELSLLNTPVTPALMAISPGATPRFDLTAAVDHHHPDHNHCEEDYCADEYELEELLQERKRRWAQERLAAAVFSHPQPLRSFCVEAFNSARELAHQKEARPANNTEEAEDPETHHEPPTNTTIIAKQQRQHQQLRPYRYHYHHGRRSRRKDFLFIHDLLDSVLHNVPLSIVLDFSSCAIDTYFESVHCTFRITATSMGALVTVLSHTTLVVWDGITNFNPFAVLDAIISLQVNAMGKTSEVLASGIQSVATGVGSASSLALHRLSRTGVGNLSVNRTGSSSSSLGGNGIMMYNGQKGRNSSGTVLQQKLLRKVSTINSAAEVISYLELADDTGGLSRHAKSRVQRMMHYDVSLRPFVATIAMPPLKTFDNIEFAGQADRSLNRGENDPEDPPSNESSPMDSPFMCTPQSFPPTPASRMTVLARSTRFADDVVFLARDKIRVHDALASDNERTREMARALSEGKRLAVFDAKDALNGIELTCGQHLATKVGNMLYCSTRSMVPILRNCFVYFEMTVMPRPIGNVVMQASMITLSIGLSTEEMPPNTLVGAWSGSVGLCTTGQILTAGQWCSPGDPSLSSYADGATVGCLVCLDDGSAFETWDGVMITAQVTFNVNGRIVPPPVSTLPTTGGASGLLPGAQMQMGLINGSIGYDPLRQNPMVPTSTLPLLVPAAEELYPTVTLHSPASAVMCRFSAEDIVASSHDSIGAPEGCTIYAVDGSVISFSQE
ncbi:Inherit from NOG: Pentatricopeptide repeat-containing protein [Seminavis robusta]|uniref:Inherit from NOG: Pentatricopeptide repeat-containing protein n=1 Tax=Seminavis robusta TaxID=568900 RepID=A0A9N8E1N0_9STRA|nr:Inherit from NOG: Pentatricopeptide repeat-containing protein [Seminavis robusta]|eukprot:Sro557_g166140.1 Inherit from NOG: Pentatricopeptide repeat-containing protein (814) ;mRNA; f:30657-33194